MNIDKIKKNNINKLSILDRIYIFALWNYTTLFLFL